MWEICKKFIFDVSGTLHQLQKDSCDLHHDAALQQIAILHKTIGQAITCLSPASVPPYIYLMNMGHIALLRNIM